MNRGLVDGLAAHIENEMGDADDDDLSRKALAERFDAEEGEIITALNTLKAAGRLTWYGEGDGYIQVSRPR